MNKFTVALILLFGMALPAICQESDTVIAVQASDTIYRFGEEGIVIADSLLVAPRRTKSPSRALMYSLALPGLGQAYNGKYWKIPIVLAAMGGAGYAIVSNTKLYKQSILDYKQIEDFDVRYLELHRRNMELSYIALIAVYGLQILDAYVDAHLYSWDVNENLSLGISPSLQPMMAPTSLTGYSGGITCSLKIRGR